MSLDGLNSLLSRRVTSDQRLISVHVALLLEIGDESVAEGVEANAHGTSNIGHVARELAAEAQPTS